MAMLASILIVIAVMYQLFFRYDTWSSEDKPGVRYEHDNLTGETRMLKPEAKVSVFARILGADQGDRESSGFLEPLNDNLAEGGEEKEKEKEKTSASSGLPGLGDLNLKDSKQVEKVARPVPVPREVVVASSAPPVPGGVNTPEYGGTPFAVRQIDLDQDGSSEEIIQNAKQSDGMLDISIVKNGREIFFARGQQISLLPTRSRGWADIALKLGSQTLQVFRYDVRSSTYKALENDQG